MTDSTEFTIVKECSSGTPLFMNVVKESTFNKCSHGNYFGHESLCGKLPSLLIDKSKFVLSLMWLRKIISPGYIVRHKDKLFFQIIRLRT